VTEFTGVNAPEIVLTYEPSALRLFTVSGISVTLVDFAPCINDAQGQP